MATTANQALPYPSLGDAANGPVAIQNLALAVEKQLVMSFANAADRTTKLPAPVEGTVAFLRDVDRLEVWNGTAWGTAADPTADTAWTTGTPFWQQQGGTNLAVGNGTSEMRWKIIGKTVFAHMLLVRGSTSNIGTAPYQWLFPTAMPNARDYRITGTATVVAAAGTTWPGIVQGIGGGAFAIVVMPGGGAANNRVTTTQPGGSAWASGDSVTCDFTYEIP